MTKKLFMLIVAFVCAATTYAQLIAVVSPEGNTTTFQSLDNAITSAPSGSVIYLPGGTFSVNNSTIINKKLTIFGVGHRADAERTEGATKILGNLTFRSREASESAVMGVYLSGNIYFGNGNSGDTIRNVMIKYCNIYSIVSNYHKSYGLEVNQCYVRGSLTGWTGSKQYSYGTKVTNCILSHTYLIQGGLISNNIITSESLNITNSVFYDCSNCTITNNIILGSSISYNTSNEYSGNMLIDNDLGANCINLPAGTTIEDIFVNPGPGISTMSDFHFKDAYKQYENQVGIYAGTGFNDKQLAPVPYIVAKQVDDQTDAQGKLNIRVRVKAGDTE